MPFGIKEFRTENKQFRLNDRPCPLRGSTVVWHRWVRTEEGARLDTTPRGSATMSCCGSKNTAPTCCGSTWECRRAACWTSATDTDWPYSTNGPSSTACRPAKRAAPSSTAAGWKPPSHTLRSASIILTTKPKATNSGGSECPEQTPAALSAAGDLERDVLHLHKYWWSIFENVGMFYDSYDQFDLPIMTDEFGGNYLDGDGEPGGYVTIRETPAALPRTQPHPCDAAQITGVFPRQDRRVLAAASARREPHRSPWPAVGKTATTGSSARWPKAALSRSGIP